MFAYCNNNPVNFIDSSGYLPYESNIASDRVMTCDASNRRFHTVVIVTPTEPIGKDVIAWFVNACNTMWDAYVHGNELQVQQQIEKDMTIRKGVEILTNDPAMAVNLTVNSVGVLMSYVGLLGALGVLTMSTPVNIAVSAIGLTCSLWGDYGTTKDFFLSYLNKGDEL